jgi:2-dehydro-3-deoxygalactonokinase
MVAVDWGTTSLRAWRLDKSGEILDRRREKLGILQIAGRAFADAFDSVVGGWLTDAPDARVLMSGMIGSRQGWVEAPYARCPAGLREVSRALVPVPERPNVYIVPGLSCRIGNSAADVMRGEETQVFGLDLPDGVAILPGTHSKWTLVRNGAVEWFASYFTGELYDVLRRHSILGRLMEDPESADPIPDGFVMGLDEALAASAPSLLHSLFTVRTRGLFNEVSPRQSPGYLSGLLIGTEIVEARAAIEKLGSLPATATLVGVDNLVALYAFALSRTGLSAQTAGEDSSARGLFRIAEAAGLISSE